MTQFVENATNEHAADPKHLTVVVHNEDDGSDAPVTVPASSLVGAAIEEVYEALGIDRQSGDRLRCEASGEDVFPHAAEVLASYRDHHCHKLHWLFAGDTGGA